MQIRQIARISDQGYSRPYQCYDDCGVLRWCKGNHTGLRSLISEWVCARVALRLHLPVPACDILRLEPRLFEDWCRTKDVRLPLLVTDANPFVFASVHVKNAKDVIDAEKDLHFDDPDLLTRIYLFDELIRNSDRTDYNSNLLSNAGVHVIDHNNAFDWAFDANEFANEHVLRRFRETADSGVIAGFRSQVRQEITEEFIDEVWSEMPAEWIDAGGVALPLDRIKDVILREKI